MRGNQRGSTGGCHFGQGWHVTGLQARLFSGGRGAHRQHIGNHDRPHDDANYRRHVTDFVAFRTRGVGRRTASVTTSLRN